MNGCRMRPAVCDGDANQDIFAGRFRVFGENVEVSAMVENAGLFEFEFWLGTGADPVLNDQAFVWKGRLRVLVQMLHVRVGRRAVEVVITFLDVLTMVSLGTRQTEKALFQNGVGAVPERDCEADLLVTVADPGDSILVPAVGAGARVIVREEIPGAAAGAIVLAYGSPCPLAEVGAPPFPVSLLLSRLGKSGMFGRGRVCGSCMGAHTEVEPGKANPNTVPDYISA